MPAYDDVRTLEDESRAWNRDDLHQVLRERVDLLFVCERETFDIVILQENIIYYTRSEVSRSAYGWSQIQAERSTREPLNSTQTRVFHVDRRTWYHSTNVVLQIVWHWHIFHVKLSSLMHCSARTLYLEAASSLLCFLCNLNTPKTRILNIANTRRIFFKVFARTRSESWFSTI